MCACGSPSSQASATPPSPSKRNAISGVLHLQGAAREALRPQRLCELVVQLERREDLRRRLTALRLAVRQPRVGADHRAVELRLARRRDLDGHAQPILVRAQRAEIVGELVRQHRRNAPRDVRRERAPRGAVVERRAGADEPRDVGDVHPGADAVGLAPERERVVEVLRGVGVDRVGEQVAQVDAVRDCRSSGTRAARTAAGRRARPAAPRARSRRRRRARGSARRAPGRGPCARRARSPRSRSPAPF